MCVYLVREFEEKCLTEWVLNYWAVTAREEGLPTEVEEGPLIWGYMLLANTHKDLSNRHIKQEEWITFFTLDFWRILNIYFVENGRGWREKRNYRCLTPGLNIWQATAPFMHFPGVYYTVTPLLSRSVSPLAARKTNLTTGVQITKRSEDFSRTLQLSSLLYEYFPAEHDLPCASYFPLHFKSRQS